MSEGSVVNRCACELKEFVPKSEMRVKGCLVWLFASYIFKEGTTRPKSVIELLCLLQDEWKKIPLAVIQRLVESMTRRVHAVIASRGGSTNY
ncbi:hypothetical protein CEXT_626731 [Caerostris extrusa]|uniref:Transposase n=1 Tax=Caerostris extrusa TaxID=172846 RepID=A0AAV4NQI5_CAEEX|nr:hypothetical protein CEXT_626731 [Caerostris extrusa]